MRQVGYLQALHREAWSINHKISKLITNNSLKADTLHAPSRLASPFITRHSFSLSPLAATILARNDPPAYTAVSAQEIPGRAPAQITPLRKTQSSHMIIHSLSRCNIHHNRRVCLYIYIYIYIYIYTHGCNRRNGPDFGRVFLMLNYTEKPQNTYIKS